LRRLIDWLNQQQNDEHNPTTVFVMEGNIQQQLAEAQAENERLTRWRVYARAARAKYHCPTCGGVHVAESELCTCEA
jgi:predicted RNA-binding Zn-ribbon protein involved in translation (DUF1610 family)